MVTLLQLNSIRRVKMCLALQKYLKTKKQIISAVVTALPLYSITVSF